MADQTDLKRYWMFTQTCLYEDLRLSPFHHSVFGSEGPWGLGGERISLSDKLESRGAKGQQLPADLLLWRSRSQEIYKSSMKGPSRFQHSFCARQTNHCHYNSA